jgi:hypothetical protein
MKAGVRAVMGVLVLCVGVGWLVGQDPKKEPEPPARVRGTLPRYYKQLGLSDEQKRAVYTVQGRYRDKIEALAEQIRKLRAEEAQEFEKVLTDAQKARLRELKLGESSKPKDADVKAADKGSADKKVPVKPLKLVPEDKKP